MIPPEERFAGVLLGTAAGDAIGLPLENLSARRAAKLFGPPPLRHRLVLGRGLVSDDTEHACMTAQAILRSRGDDADVFVRSLAWRLRWWVVGLPAGVGLATLRSCVRLWLGFPPTRSGVRSAGNGPAMRAPAIGVALAHDATRLAEFVRLSTNLTHRDPRAEAGALAVALAARHGALSGPDGVDAAVFLDELQRSIRETELLSLVRRAIAFIGEGRSIGEFAEFLGAHGRVSGYINQTVPVALFAWLRWPGDIRAAVEQVVLLGGDTDTTAALTGALVGATAGADGIPTEWLDRLIEWPRSRRWMRELARRLAAAATGEQARPLPLFWPGALLRNVIFIVIVFAHGFRRLLPPY
jgi:ADP-ribosylglycohydrolase